MTQPTRDPKWKHERLTSPAKGFAPFLAPLGARGDVQNSGRRPNYRIPVAYRWRSTYSLPMLYQYYRQLPSITVCLWPAYGIGKQYCRRPSQDAGRPGFQNGMVS